MPYGRGRTARGRSARPAVRRYPIRRRYTRPGRRTEIKSVDVTPQNIAAMPLLSAQAYAEPAAFTGYTVVNVVTLGAGVNQRIGTKINIRSVHVKAQIGGRTPATTNCVVRMTLVYDRQCNGAAPAIGAILADLTTAGVASTTPNCGLTIQNRSRFHVIADNFINMSFSASTTYNYKCWRKGFWPTEYGATAGTIADITSGAIYLIASDSNGGAAEGCNLGSISSRIRYSDQ